MSLPGVVGVTVADINGDGYPDLVSGAVDIAFGNGKGQFSPPVYYPVASGTGITVAAPLRGKGLVDLVAGGDNVISVLLNNGKAKFLEAESVPVTGGAGCAVGGDFNGDGKPDIAVITAQGISILLGTGKAAAPYTPGSTIALSGAACPVTGDLNGDGIPDLLVPLLNTVVAYLGNGDGTFTLKSTTSTPPGGYMALGDFNHDGKLDFATAGNLLALGNGDGTFQTPAPFFTTPPPTGFTNIGATDLNNDGWTDIVLVNQFNYNLFVLVNNQHGGFTQTTISAGSYFAVTFADLNGDGNLDMVAASTQGVAVFLGNGQGGLTLKQAPTDALGLGGPVTVADVNGDGIPDIAYMEGGTLALFLGKGDGTFTASSAYFGAGVAPGALLAQNLHGQPASAGKPDIVEPDFNLGIVVLPNLTK